MYTNKQRQNKLLITHKIGYSNIMNNKPVICNTCFHHCILNDGQTGYCRARWNKNGCICAKNYGQLTALALDPIEKKPLAMFFPGSLILSEGSYGCNLRCPFCQNSEISQAGSESRTEYVSPEQLAGKAAERMVGHPKLVHPRLSRLAARRPQSA